jgi:hypothetical protein
MSKDLAYLRDYLPSRRARGKPEMFESLASCFAFRCSASRNMKAESETPDR